MATRRTKTTVGDGSIRFDSLEQRDEVARLAGWTEIPPGNSLFLWVDRRGIMGRRGTVGTVKARGADVLRELRAGRSWPGLSVAGYPLHRGNRPKEMGFGCWTGTVAEAEAILAACRAAKRRKRPSPRLGLCFAERQVGSTSAGTARLFRPGSGTTYSNPSIELPLRHLELLVGAMKRK